MGGVRPASRMRPVELVDDDDERPWPGDGAARVRPTRGGADVPPGSGEAGRRRRPWVLGALAVTVGVAAVATAVTERAAREQADAFAALPGVVRPLDSAPTERWRAPAGGPTPVLAADGALVTVSGAQGRWVVRASDVATGAVRWEQPVVEQPGAGYESVAVACTGGTEPPALLLCTWAEPNVVYGGSGESTSHVPPTQVLALDPQDGERRGTWQIDQRLLDVERQADDLLVATGLRDRRVLVERRDGTDGSVRWSWTSPGALVDDGGIRPLPSLTVAGGVVALVAHATTLLDARTGGVLEEGPPGRQIRVAAVPDGGYVVWEPGVGGTLRDADGDVRASAPGLPLTVVGDGSVGHLLVDAGNQVLAARPSDGAVVWEVMTSMAPVAVVRGVVVMAGGASVGAVDGADGRLLWEQELVDELYVDPLTDGRNVFVVEPDGDGLLDLVARGLHDGVEAWRVALPPDLRRIEAVAGRIVLRVPPEVVVLG